MALELLVLVNLLRASLVEAKCAELSFSDESWEHGIFRQTLIITDKKPSNV